MEEEETEEAKEKKKKKTWEINGYLKAKNCIKLLFKKRIRY
ncbi:MAG: hypothetical protein ACE5K4_04560 [Candidatus Hydrothermarchaeota archaeon]